MAEAVWNGSLRLSLVSCPVYLTAATSNAPRVRLDLLSSRTGNLVTEQFVDTKTGDVVGADALVKGYEHAPSQYITVSQDELDKLGSGNIIDLEQFVPRQQIDHLYIDQVYYVHAEGQLAMVTVQALRLAMQKSARVAIGHARMGDSDRPALIEPHGGGLMVSTLRTKDELAPAEFGEPPNTDVPTDMVEIAEAIIARRATDFDAATLQDRYQDELRKLVNQKARNAPPGSGSSGSGSPGGRSRRGSSSESPPPASESASSARAPEPAAEPPAAEAAPPEPEPAAAAPAPEPETPPPAPEPEPPPPAPEPEAAAAPPAPEPEPAPEAAPAPEPEPAAAEGPHDIGTEILLHIMGLGDRRYVEPGWAGNPGSKRQIEALSIRPREGLAPSAIEFRVYAQEGRATAWVSNGNYAGTRGRNLPLTGFAVRPVSDLGERLDIAYEGSFFEGGVVGPKRNGELCISPVADDPLEAVRVTIIDQGGDAAAASPAE
jgi:DNA end-binding protein Ku